MNKTYDQVEWSFLEDMMRRLDFCDAWIDLILWCVKSVSYSIMLNDKKGVDFKPTKGLRQGDP